MFIFKHYCVKQTHAETVVHERVIGSAHIGGEANPLAQSIPTRGHVLHVVDCQCRNDNEKVAKMGKFLIVAKLLRKHRNQHLKKSACQFHNAFRHSPLKYGHRETKYNIHLIVKNTPFTSTKSSTLLFSVSFMVAT